MQATLDLLTTLQTAIGSGKQRLQIVGAFTHQLFTQ